MSRRSGKHIVVVEAYQGHFEFLSDEPEELKSAQGLGLPIEEIAEALDCRITVFCWDEWLRYELSHGLSYGSPFTWAPNPVTRPACHPDDRFRRADRHYPDVPHEVPRTVRLALQLDDPGSESDHARAHLHKDRETAARFGGEIAMLPENRMMPHMHTGVQEMSGRSVKPTNPMQYRFRNLVREALTKRRRLPAGKMREPASDG